LQGTIKRKQKNEDVNVITGIRRLSPKKHYFSKLSNYHRLTYFDFWTTNPRNIARQLALLNFYLLKQIRPNELVGTGWMRKDKYERSPHLMALIDSNTRVTYWIARKIVEERSIVNRARMISSILGIMKECEVLQNFSAVVMLYSSLSCSSVFRLHSTKAVGFNQLCSSIQSFSCYPMTIDYYLSITTNFVIHIGKPWLFVYVDVPYPVFHLLVCIYPSWFTWRMDSKTIRR
jgi:hypothetical protein